MSKKRKNVIVSLLSLIYTIFIIVGKSFYESNSFEYIINNLLINIFFAILIFFFLFFILKKIFVYLDNLREKRNNKIGKKSKVITTFLNHPFLFSLLFIIICWLPYIISFYPIILSPDPSFQIKQFFGIPNKYSTYVIMLDPKVTITNHHPVLHTILLGTCLKIGTIIGNDNLGLFLYSIIQILILSSTLAYTICFLKEKGMNYKYLIVMLLIYSFVPVFPFYAMSAVKDVIFGSLIILYIINIYKISKEQVIDNKTILKNFLLFILVILFRNNGIHTILLSFPFLFLLKRKKEYKIKILVLFILTLTFNTTYNNVILPGLKITQTSVREKLSIPFQQTARYVKEHSKEIKEDEKEIIDKILGYETLASRYNAELADPVKNEYNKYATKKDLSDYFKVWFQQFLKHPVTYFEATINNTYGYFYPEKTNWYIYYKYDKRIVEDGFEYHYNGLKESRKILSTFGKEFYRIPIIGLLINIALNVWVLIFMLMYYFYRKKYQSIIYLIPSFVLVLVCFASPVNAYFRYALPYIFANLLNIGLFIKEIKE